MIDVTCRTRLAISLRGGIVQGQSLKCTITTALLLKLTELVVSLDAIGGSCESLLLYHLSYSLSSSTLTSRSRRALIQPTGQCKAPHPIPLLQSGQRSSSTPDPRFSAESFRDETPMPATTLTDEEIVNKVTDSDVIVPKKHSLISSPSSSSTDLPALSIPASTQDNRATQDDQTFDNNIDSTRPRRTVRSPLRYEPETGAWI